MAEFQFKCPQCGQVIEADESFRGQVAPCPFCEKNIVVPSAKPLVTTSKPKPKQPISWKQDQQTTNQGDTVGNHVELQPETTTAQKPQAVPQQGLKRYFTSKGRASRKEFWISLFLPIPFIGLLGSVRRLHDLNKCEWWLLAPIACIIAAKVSGMEMVVKCADVMGYVWLIILGTLNGTLGDNDYGPDPKGRISVGRKTPAAAIAIPILTVLMVVGILIASLVKPSKGEETMPESSADKEAQESRDTSDMVTIDGVMIRRLPDTEFTKFTNDDGVEMFRAALPEDDGFTPGINIQILDHDIEPKDLPKTPRQMKEFMDVVISGALEARKGLEEQGLIDMKIVDRSDNTFTLLMEFNKHFAYHKQIVDVRSGRVRQVSVTGIWKLNKDKRIIKVCVDSARLAAQ